MAPAGGLSLPGRHPVMAADRRAQAADSIADAFDKVRGARTSPRVGRRGPGSVLRPCTPSLPVLRPEMPGTTGQGVLAGEGSGVETLEPGFRKSRLLNRKGDFRTSNSFTTKPGPRGCNVDLCFGRSPQPHASLSRDRGCCLLREKANSAPTTAKPSTGSPCSVTKKKKKKNASLSGPRLPN